MPSSGLETNNQQPHDSVLKRLIKDFALIQAGWGAVGLLLLAELEKNHLPQETKPAFLLGAFGLLVIGTLGLGKLVKDAFSLQSLAQEPVPRTPKEIGETIKVLNAPLSLDEIKKLTEAQATNLKPPVNNQGVVDMERMKIPDIPGYEKRMSALETIARILADPQIIGAYRDSHEQRRATLKALEKILLAPHLLELSITERELEFLVSLLIARSRKEKSPSVVCGYIELFAAMIRVGIYQITTPSSAERKREELITRAVRAQRFARRPVRGDIPASMEIKAQRELEYSTRFSPEMVEKILEAMLQLRTKRSSMENVKETFEKAWREVELLASSSPAFVKILNEFKSQYSCLFPSD